MGRYFPPFGSFVHNILTHFYPQKFNESQQQKVKNSYVILFLGMISISSLLVYFTGSIWSVFHYYIIPGIFFQFWMSLYTFQHHTSEDMKFYNPKEWNQYKGQILSTYNSLSPRFLSFLHMNIDIHTPHHLSTAIPCYHLRPAYEDLKKSIYREDMKEGKLDLGYYLQQIRNCHLWDDKNLCYKKFSEVENIK
jgi:omega-6 fatty acid desaturase (delta-12 desaturase)